MTSSRYETVGSQDGPGVVSYTTGSRVSPFEEWNTAIDSFVGRRLLVIGDVMLDKYLSGDCRRVCPEAPVPVVEVSRRWFVPGGAANAAANAAALGGILTLGGVTGDDEAATELARAAREAKVDPSGFVTDPSRPTTVKLRVLARGQQVARADVESTAPLPPGPAGQLVAWAERSVKDADVVLLSDYGKGVVSAELASRVIESSRRSGCPVVVDPKGSDPGRYLGATVVKPNLSELGDLVGRAIRTPAEMIEAGQRLAEALPRTAVLVTRGADGMALFHAGDEPLLLPAAPARRVYDVTGAGDTVAAVLALGLAAGLAVEKAARMANAAASLAVCKVGTAVVTPDELLSALLESAQCYAPVPNGQGV